MKRSPLALLVLALIAGFTLTLLPTQQSVTAAEGDSHKVLEETMEVLASNYRLVRRQSRDASKNADTAAKLAEMIDASVRAKGAIPGTATTDDLKKTYQVVMNKLIIELALAENAALTGDMDALKKHVAAANTVKGEGHELFIADDE